MSNVRTSFFPAGLLATSLLTLAPATALASGFSTARFGGEHGTPVAINPTGIYYNPGSLGAARGLQVFVDGNIAFRGASFYRSPTTNPDEDPEPADGQGANNGKAGLFNVAAAPMVGITAGAPVGPVNLGGGIGFFVPFGGSATWDQNDAFRDHASYPGPVDGTQRWYTIHGTQRTMYLSGALGAGFLDGMLNVGVSGGVAFSSIDSIRARAFPGGSTSLSEEGRAWFKGSSVDPHLGVGVLASLLDHRLRLGFSYQAPTGLGEMKLKGLLQKWTFPGNLAGSVEGVNDVELHQTMPDVFRFGASFQVMRDLQLRAFGDVHRWSLFDKQCIAKAGTADKPGVCDVDASGKPTPETVGEVNLPRNWQDAFGIRVGMSYWVKRPIEIFAGVGYDGNAVPDEVLDPALTDFHDVSVAGGAKLRFADRVALALSYTHFFYFSRDTTGKSTNYQLDAFSQGPDAGGVYKQNIGVVNINLQVSFDPFGAKGEKQTAFLLQD